MSTTLCTECGHPFAPKLDERPTLGGIKQTFACPSCGHIYPVAKISHRGLALRARMQDVYGTDQDEFQRLLARFESEVVRLG